MLYPRPKVLQHPAFRLRVEGARRLVQYQYGILGIYGTGYGQPLHLTFRQTGPALAELRVKAPWQFPYKTVRACHGQCLPQPFLSLHPVRASKRDRLTHAAGKKYDSPAGHRRTSCATMRREDAPHHVCLGHTSRRRQ